MIMITNWKLIKVNDSWDFHLNKSQADKVIDRLKQI